MKMRKILIERFRRIWLIERLTKKIKLFNENTLLGSGDDAAIINSSKEILVSSDMLVKEYILIWLSPL